MVALHRCLAWLGLGLLVCVAVGMVVRGKLRHSVVFSVYVAAVITFGTLIFTFPAYYTPEAYTIKQGIYDSLLLGMSLDLAHRTFAAFRGIADRVRAFLAIAVAVSSAVVFFLTPTNPEYSDLAQYQPGITTAGVWCLSFVGLLIVWYQIPVPPFTRAIILGVVCIFGFYVVFIDLIGRLGWGALRELIVLYAIVYDIVAAYWTVAAWRKD
jgi:hypothetical protein